MSFPDFGIYPEELRKANRLIISIAKNYNLTENDLDDADDIAKDIINIRLREEKYPLNKLTINCTAEDTKTIESYIASIKTPDKKNQAA